MTKKKISIATLADELTLRLNSEKSVDCCKDELLNLAAIAKEKIGSEMIEVTWSE